MNIRATPPIKAEINERNHPDIESNKCPIKVCVKVKIMLDQDPKANKGMGIRATPPPSKLKSLRAITQMRTVSWVSDSRSFLTKIPRTSDTPFLIMVTIHTSAKAKEFKRKFNGFSKPQKLGV
jgi:hypothetical protein